MAHDKEVFYTQLEVDENTFNYKIYDRASHH